MSHHHNLLILVALLRQHRVADRSYCHPLKTTYPLKAFQSQQTKKALSVFTTPAFPLPHSFLYHIFLNLLLTSSNIHILYQRLVNKSASPVEPLCFCIYCMVNPSNLSFIFLKRIMKRENAKPVSAFFLCLTFIHLTHLSLHRRLSNLTYSLTFLLNLPSSKCKTLPQSLCSYCRSTLYIPCLQPP